MFLSSENMMAHFSVSKINFRIASHSNVGAPNYIEVI